MVKPLSRVCIPHVLFDQMCNQFAGAIGAVLRPFSLSVFLNERDVDDDGIDGLHIPCAVRRS